jgi:elongator complex protein 2
VANGFTGALHCWRIAPKHDQSSAKPLDGPATPSPAPPFSINSDSEGFEQSAASAGDEAQLASPTPAPHSARLATPVPSAVGHCGAVVDACWAVDGECLLTASTDQTVRIVARDTAGQWYEAARPQVHGHDFHAVAAIPQPGRPGRFMYASASEEKVIRVFVAPRAFAQSLALLRGRAWSAADADDSLVGATVPALGLSNKAVREGEEGGAEPEPEGSMGYGNAPDFAPHQAPIVIQVRSCPVLIPVAIMSCVALGLPPGISWQAVYCARLWSSAASPGVLSGQASCSLQASAMVVMQGRPLEEVLSQSTLWPEVHKLYGHGNDVFTLAACPQGTALVSASKAQSPASAELRVWDCRHPDFVQTQTLKAHKLTVTQLRFSSDGRFLLSASRDRCVCVHQAQHLGSGAKAVAAQASVCSCL